MKGNSRSTGSVLLPVTDGPKVGIELAPSSPRAQVGIHACVVCVCLCVSQLGAHSVRA